MKDILLDNIEAIYYCMFCLSDYNEIDFFNEIVSNHVIAYNHNTFDIQELDKLSHEDLNKIKSKYGIKGLENISFLLITYLYNHDLNSTYINNIKMCVTNPKLSYYFKIQRLFQHLLDKKFIYDLHEFLSGMLPEITLAEVIEFFKPITLTMGVDIRLFDDEIYYVLLQLKHDEKVLKNIGAQDIQFKESFIKKLPKKCQDAYNKGKNLFKLKNAGSRR